MSASPNRFNHLRTVNETDSDTDKENAKLVDRQISPHSFLSSSPDSAESSSEDGSDEFEEANNQSGDSIKSGIRAKDQTVTRLGTFATVVYFLLLVIFTFMSILGRTTKHLNYTQSESFAKNNKKTIESFILCFCFMFLVFKTK